MSNTFFVTPTKNYSVPFQPNGVYYGIVKRVDVSINRVWVEIPRLVPDFQYGPLSVVGGLLPLVGENVAVMFVENSTENLVVLGKFLGVGDVTETTTSVTLTTVTPTVIKSVSGVTYRSVKFMVQVRQGSNFLLTEILVIHDGSVASFTEYGRVVVGSAPATFDVDLTGSLINLIATSASASATNYKILATVIAD